MYVLELPATKMRKTADRAGLGDEKQGSNFAHTEYKMSIIYSSS